MKRKGKKTKTNKKGNLTVSDRGKKNLIFFLTIFKSDYMQIKLCKIKKQPECLY